MKPSAEDSVRLGGGLRAALQGCMAPPGLAHSLPPACYSDIAAYDLEVARIFRRGWLGLGRADQVKRAGDFSTFEIAGVPLVLLRDTRGSLRAFANSCRHRGARLLNGSGRCRAISCPFHCWTYDLDGRLIGCPDMGSAADFDQNDYGLVEFPCAEREGFVFTCFEADAPDLDVHLGDFEAMHKPWPLAKLVSTRRQTFVVACNWKAFLDVFNEYYHLKYVHPRSLGQIYRPPDAADATRGAYASQFGVTDGTGALLVSEQDQALPTMPGLGGRWAEGVRYTWIFPNMTFAAGRESLWVYEAYPIGPDRCLVHQTACFPSETVEAAGFEQRVAPYYRRLDAAMEEDIVALENQHAGLVSPFARAGRFCAELEANVAAFAAWYAGRLLSSN